MSVQIHKPQLGIKMYQVHKRLAFGLLVKIVVRPWLSWIARYARWSFCLAVDRITTVLSLTS